MGLHSAAANGNIGLVKYALSHGQPINSVLDGVLPLHAASSGGSDLVVSLLLEHGADVNAPRLPRRYSDKHRDNSAPIVGSSGSTPLHFAAANGHSSVVRTLLLHGAHADRSDKHGVTPEMLARENGMVATADVLREWLANKDKDLREREGGGEEAVTSSGGRRTSCVGPLDAFESSVNRRRLHVKQSIEFALNTLKAHSYPDSSHAARQPSPAADPISPLGEYSFYPDTDGEVPSQRRPSLPHIYDLPLPSSSSSPGRRPRSAGQDAEPDPPRPPPPRKLGSKYSLLNLFRKGGDTPESSPYNNPSSIASTPSASPSPAPATIPLPASSSSPRALPSSPPDPSPLANRHRPRMASDSSLDAAGGSGADDDPPAKAASILRTHNRASSSGQSQIQAASFRALRFDSAGGSGGSGGASLGAKARNGVIRVLGLERSLSPSARVSVRRSNSASSLRGRERRVVVAEEEEERGEGGEREVVSPTSAPAGVVDFEEEEYGEVIGGAREGRSRASSSVASSGSSMLSPDSAAPEQGFPFSIDRPPPVDVLDDQHQQQLQHQAPLTAPLLPPLPSADSRLRGDSVSSMSTDGSAHPQLSWSSTTMATSSSSVDSGGGMTTPATSHLTLPGPTIVSSPTSLPRDLLEDKEAEEGVVGGEGAYWETRYPTLGTRRPHVPTDIDIRAISSHAQAEAWVQRAQQSILDMECGLSDDDDGLRSGVGVGGVGAEAGRSPLSAKLAAYGESLALERRLKLEEEGKAGAEPVVLVVHSEGLGLVSPASAPVPVREGGRSGSPRVVEAPRSANPSRLRIRQPRRPNTSDSGSLFFFFYRSFDVYSLWIFQPPRTGPRHSSRASCLHAPTTSHPILRLQSKHPRSRWTTTTTTTSPPPLPPPPSNPSPPCCSPPSPGPSRRTLHLSTPPRVYRSRDVPPPHPRSRSLTI